MRSATKVLSGSKRQILEESIVRRISPVWCTETDSSGLTLSHSLKDKQRQSGFELHVLSVTVIMPLWLNGKWSEVNLRNGLRESWKVPRRQKIFMKLRKFKFAKNTPDVI